MKKIIKSKNAFTLVELIIVITILTILATISFVVFSFYIKQSRDTNRITTLGSIQKGLNIQNIQSGIYPYPDYVSGTGYINNNLLTIVGKVGDNISNSIKINKVGTDPLTQLMYTYAISSDSKNYQLASINESESKAYVIGNYKGVYYDKTNNTISNIPSLIYNGSGNLLSTGTYFVVNQGVNLPDSYNLGFSGSTQSQSDTLKIVGSNTGTITNISVDWSGSGAVSLSQNLGYPVDIIGKNIFGEEFYNKPILSLEVFGDEDIDAINACNLWIKNNIGTKAGGYQNWVWVPSRYFITDGVGIPLSDSFYKRTVLYNSINYICKGFAVMKYEARFASTIGKIQPFPLRKTWTVSDYSTDNDIFPENLSSGIVSKAQDYPIANIRQGEAINACIGLNSGNIISHLITNNEWMSIARNIESQSQNRTNGVVGSGGIYRGNVGTVDIMSYSSLSGTSIYSQASGNDTDLRGNNLIGNRRLIFSNKSNIWDISGNVAEHVNKRNNPNTSNIRTNGIGNGFDDNNFPTENICSDGSFAWRGWYSTDAQGTTVCTMKNGYLKINYGPIGNYNANNGMGKIYGNNSETKNNIFIRGSDGGGGPKGGIFSLVTDWEAIKKAEYTGFRCSF